MSLVPKRCVIGLREKLYGLYEMDNGDEDAETAEDVEIEISEPDNVYNEPSGISVSSTTGEDYKSVETMIPMKKNLDVKLIKASGVSSFHISKLIDEDENDDEEPFSTNDMLNNFGLTTTPTPNLKNETLFQEILHTSTTSFIENQFGENNVDKSVIDKFFEEVKESEFFTSN